MENRIVTDQEFEEAFAICQQYVKQIAQKLREVKARMVQINADKPDESKYLNVGIASLTPDSKISDLKGLDGRTYNILNAVWGKNAPLSSLSEVTENEFKEFRNVGTGVLNRVKGVMAVTNISFKK